MSSPVRSSRAERPRPPAPVTFAAAAGRAEEFPRLGLPEIAFAGRSNVGKSSLLNALAGGVTIARTSRTPGRTRSINFFRAGPIALVDLPGYGYAKVSKEERNRWKTVVESYLGRSELALVVLIVDARHTPTPSDRQMVEWLQSRAVPLLVALSKADKLSRALVPRTAAEAAVALAIAADDVQPVSAVTHAGVPELWRTILSRVPAGSHPPRARPPGRS